MLLDILGLVPYVPVHADVVQGVGTSQPVRTTRHIYVELFITKSFFRHLTIRVNV